MFHDCIKLKKSLVVKIIVLALDQLIKFSLKKLFLLSTSIDRI